MTEAMGCLVMKTNTSINYSSYIEALLQDYDVSDVGEGWYRSRCPLHKGDNPSSFSINKWGKFRCFSCGERGDMAGLLMRLHGIGFKQAKELLREAPARFVDLGDLPTLPPFDGRFAAVDEGKLREADIALYRKECPKQLINRGFTRQALRRYEIGYDARNCRIVLPIRSRDGRLVGVTHREDMPGSLRVNGRAIKYWHDHFDKSKHLYGFHLVVGKDAQGIIFLAEGQLDVIRLSQLGYTAAAIMGSSISEVQIELLIKHFNGEIALAFDNDEAGIKATRDAISKLTKTRFGRELLIAVYPTNDPGELERTGSLGLHHWTEKRLLNGNN